MAGLFVMIGGEPCTGWLQGTVALDKRDLSGAGLTMAKNGLLSPVSPYLTALPSVFSIGDVLRRFSEAGCLQPSEKARW